MPTTVTYPGVYIEEVPSQVRTIAGVPTSVTAFVGAARRGPVDEPTLVHGFAEFTRTFGGLWTGSALGHAVQQFFDNGGGDALIVRVARWTDTANAANNASRASLTLPGPAAPLVLRAASPGRWSDGLRARVDLQVEARPGEDASKMFNLFLREGSSLEEFRNVSVDPAHRRFIRTVLEESALVRLDETVAVPAAPPLAHGAFTNDPFESNATSTGVTAQGTDGDPLQDDDVVGAQAEADKRGLFALLKADIFNLLVVPPLQPGSDVSETVWEKAAKHCADRRAILLVDPKAAWKTPAAMRNGLTGPFSNLRNAQLGPNAALFFPQVRIGDPLREGRLADFPPSGAVAGIIARTDTRRGLWKAPAGQEAGLSGVKELAAKLTDAENGELNPLGVNCLRSFAEAGRVVWGARTMRGSDQAASEWKYLPVRRTALYIEESLYRGTQWAVFEPNDEPLWAQVRLNVGAFMHGLFRQGAFQGKSPREAFFVKCDRETTTQDDINRGIVNIHVGFAPLKPAEFVVIRISQIAGAVAT